MQANTKPATANPQGSKTSIPPETIGRQYHLSRFGVHSRKLGTDTWYGASNYKTLREAQDALEGVGQRYVSIGGLTMDFGESQDVYEYRVVQIESMCKVISTCYKKV